MKKITFNFLMPALACALIFTSCGNKNEANGETAASDSTKTEEPAKRQSGIKVANVQELVQKLVHDAKVIG